MGIPYAAPDIGLAEVERVTAVLRSGQIASGPVVREFEEAFARFVKVKHAIAVANGTVALDAAIASLKLTAGDHVLTTPFTFIATSNAIIHNGLHPVFADIEPQTYNIDPNCLREVLAKDRQIRAIVVVHLYGLPCNMDPILQEADRWGLPVIEDCAQAHAATYHGKAVGAMGRVGTFSFYPTKNMTTGEGGMIVTNDDETASFCRKIVNHGRVAQYEYDEVGHNFRLTDLAAAIGLCQLEKLPDYTRARIHNAQCYDQLLLGIPGLIIPVVPGDCTHVYHQYTIRVRNREILLAKLHEAKIGHAVVYPIPLHRQPIYQRLGIGDGNYLEAEAAAMQVVSLPVHPKLRPEDIETVASVVEEALNSTSC